MSAAFTIRILEQGWIDGSSPEHDLCSHGRISLVIGDTKIADENESLGVSESALAMLRTLESDHGPRALVAERMVFHGCGAILMTGCPIGIDWSVSHTGETVRIGDVVWSAETNENLATRYPGLSVDVPLSDYRAQVVAFATEAEGLFSGVEKRLDDELDREQHKDFWTEYRGLIQKQLREPGRNR